MRTQTLLLIRTEPLTAEEASRLPPTFQAVVGANPVIARADISMTAKEVVNLAVQTGRAVLDTEIVFHEQMAPSTGTTMSLEMYARNIEQIQSLAIQSPGGISLSMSASQPSPSDILDVDVIQDEMDDSSIRSTGMTLASQNQKSIFDRMSEAINEDEVQPDQVKDWWEFVEIGQTDIALQILQDKGTPTHDDQSKAREFLKSDNPEHVVFVCFAARHFQWKAWALTLRRIFSHSDARVRAAAVSAVGDLAGPSLSPAVYPLTSDPDPEVRRAAQAAFRKLDR